MNEFEILGHTYHIKEVTGKDFANLLIKAFKEAKYKFSKENLAIRFIIIENCDFGFLVYSEKLEEEKEKEALW